MNNYRMILSQNHTASFDFKDNGNVLVLGQVGTYKTRGHVLPNITEQDEISMVISDTKGELASIFYSLLLSRLRTVADNQPDKGLPIHVHFFMDEFATNVVVPNFPNYISCLRSREISFTLVLQSENQLKTLYGEASNTVISNCAYYLFLGSRDLPCCQDIAKRMNIPLDKVLNKARSDVFIISDFRRPLVDTIYGVRTHPCYGAIENDGMRT